jgi:hypothetical protein
MFLLKDILSDKDILARTIYGEARGELQKFGKKSLCAIANVVINRLKKGAMGNQLRKFALGLINSHAGIRMIQIMENLIN